MSGGRQTLDLGRSRVLIGFDESRVAARMEGGDLVMHDDLADPDADDPVLRESTLLLLATL